MLAGAVIRLFGALTEGEFKPLEVQLMNETGAPMERYRAVYGCPTILGMPRYALVFDAAVLDKPSRHAARNCCACTSRWRAGNWPRWSA